MEDYKIAEKHPGAVILCPSYPHLRPVAQSGCFLVPGRISKEVSSDIVRSQVILSEELVLDSITKLRGLCVSMMNFYFLTWIELHKKPIAFQ